MRRPGSNEQKGGAVGSLGDEVCAICRHRAPAAGDGRLKRCPTHPDRVLVALDDLADADGDPFMGMVIGERFAVLARLGAGSMGTVYRARQEKMGRDVALKIVRSERLVDPQAKGRFQQEAHATSLLTSQHTVTVFDFGEITLDEDDDPHMISGSLFLAMELLDGVSLGTRLKKEGPVDPREAVRIVRQALMSLAEAHDKGVIHRDLKPDNLLLTRAEDGEPICKVLDFGIAKLLTHQGGIDALETQAGTVFGTPRYMSPEQAQGKPLDARSDVYSLGVILYHMLTGRPPFTDGDAVVVMAHHIKTVPTRPSEVRGDIGVPASLEDLLMRVLDKDPARRPQSARAFVSALDNLGPLDPVQTSAEMAAVVGRRPAAAATSRRMVVVGGSMVAAAVGVLAAMLASGGQPDAKLLQGGLSSASIAFALEAMSQLAPAAVETDNDGPETAPKEAEPTTAEAPTTPKPTPKGVKSSPKSPSAPRGYERFDR